MSTSKKKQPAFPRAMMAALAAIEKATPTPPARAMPADESVLLRIPFKPPSGAPAFTILRTHRVDAYDPPALAALVTMHGVMALAAISGDDFTGKERKAAKISIADAPMEEFADLKDLIATLPSKKFMKEHKPKITTTQQSDRVPVEKRNVRVHAFLYAANSQKDNDFHLIIGRDPNADKEIYMNVEISGLPPSDSPAFPKLRGARKAFKKYFGDKLPGKTYDFYTESPRPVLIEGSLFFDMSHASGHKPGPPELSPMIPTIWEVHPITRIKFKS